MKTELLVIKTDKGYCRFTDNDVNLCDMNKATVYPISEIEKVKENLNALNRERFPDAGIYLLTITEKKFKAQ